MQISKKKQVKDSSRSFVRPRTPILILDRSKALPCPTRM